MLWLERMIFGMKQLLHFPANITHNLYYSKTLVDQDFIVFCLKQNISVFESKKISFFFLLLTIDTITTQLQGFFLIFT
jgi:hypothetical protein